MKLGFNNAKVALNDKKIRLEQIEKEIVKKQKKSKEIKELCKC